MQHATPASSAFPGRHPAERCALSLQLNPLKFPLLLWNRLPYFVLCTSWQKVVGGCATVALIPAGVFCARLLSSRMTSWEMSPHWQASAGLFHAGRVGPCNAMCSQRCQDDSSLCYPLSSH